MSNVRAPRSRLSWLHLSDLHLRAGDEFEQSVVVTSLLADLREHLSAGEELDFVFFTGDIAFSGQAKDYEVARGFFDELTTATGVPLDRIFCVPGNHDVDRSRLTSFTEASTATLISNEVVTSLLARPHELALFTDRLVPYAEFRSAVFPWAKGSKSTDLSFTQTFEVGGIQLALIGLNSAWLSGSDNDLGRLVVGERQVREALGATGDADMIVALIHHPINWLNEFDGSRVSQLLNARCDFVLHGHLHDVSIVNAVTPDSQTFYFAAGAAYVDGSLDLSYNRVTLDFDDAEARIALRRYSARHGGFWAADTGMYQSAPGGLLRLGLPERLSHRPEPVRVSAELAPYAAETPSALATAAEGPEPPSPPQTLLDEIREGRCILFAGAGASMDAKLPDWYELLRGMIDQAIAAGVASPDEVCELQDLLADSGQMIVAAFCRDKLGKYEFAKYIRERLSYNRESRTHRLLANIPFRAAMTTNFDEFIERSRENAEVVLPDQMNRVGAAGIETLLKDGSRFPVIKIHGTATDVDSIVLTRGDLRRVLFETPKAREFLHRLFIDATVFFYGYGFSDGNVDLLLQELTSEYSGNARPHYALLPEPGSIATRYWFEDFNLRVIPYKLWNGSHLAATAFLEEIAGRTGPPHSAPVDPA